MAASLDIPVAKHGNRSVSSSSGSADVLEKLGVNVDVSVKVVSQCLDEIGIGFCFAPLMHGAMKHAAPIRRGLGFPTIFNLLGPLTNPAGAEFQLLGASRTGTAKMLAAALAELGRKRAFVVCGNDELDEVSLWGRTVAWEVNEDSMTAHEWTAASFGLDECSPDDLCVDSAVQSANVIRKVLAGETGPCRDIVVANVAAALLVVCRAEDPLTAAQIAASALDSGQAEAKLMQLVNLTNA